MKNLKEIFLELLDKFKEILKSKINKTPIPSLLSFFINPKAKDPFNPTLEEVKNSAPDPKDNWVRLGLDKITSFGLPIWLLFVGATAIIAIRYGSESLIYIFTILVSLGSQGIVLFFFFGILYLIWSKFKK